MGAGRYTYRHLPAEVRVVVDAGNGRRSFSAKDALVSEGAELVVRGMLSARSRNRDHNFYFIFLLLLFANGALISRGCIFSCVRPSYERAVSDLDP